MTNIRRYTAEDKALWDRFVSESRNSTFLFLRDFMEYHRDRFTDHSLLFCDSRGRLIGLLPANESTDDAGHRRLISHQGLTYGGLVLSDHTTAPQVLKMMDGLTEYAAVEGFSYILYKVLPTIYHRRPSQEDLYALFRHDAQLEGCNLACTIDLQETPPIPMERRRLRGQRKAATLGYQTEKGELEEFWPIMTDNLKTCYHASPAHSLKEMQYLQGLFPRQIRCTLARDAQGNAQAGAVVFQTEKVVHVQYGHATPQGKADGALDLLYTSLMEQYRQAGIHYFDFGTSNEQDGRILNEKLIAQKEGFGGRGIACPTYRIKIVK